MGVCAVCRVDARPDHFHTASHLERAAAWDRAREAEEARRRQAMKEES